MHPPVPYGALRGPHHYPVHPPPNQHAPICAARPGRYHPPGPNFQSHPSPYLGSPVSQSHYRPHVGGSFSPSFDSHHSPGSYNPRFSPGSPCTPSGDNTVAGSHPAPEFRPPRPPSPENGPYGFAEWARNSSFSSSPPASASGVPSPPLQSSLTAAPPSSSSQSLQGKSTEGKEANKPVRGAGDGGQGEEVGRRGREDSRRRAALVDPPRARTHNGGGRARERGSNAAPGGVPPTPVTAVRTSGKGTEIEYGEQRVSLLSKPHSRADRREIDLAKRELALKAKEAETDTIQRNMAVQNHWYRDQARKMRAQQETAKQEEKRYRDLQRQVRRQAQELRAAARLMATDPSVLENVAPVVASVLAPTRPSRRRKARKRRRAPFYKAVYSCHAWDQPPVARRAGITDPHIYVANKPGRRCRTCKNQAVYQCLGCKGWKCLSQACIRVDARRCTPHKLDVLVKLNADYGYHAPTAGGQVTDSEVVIEEGREGRGTARSASQSSDSRGATAAEGGRGATREESKEPRPLTAEKVLAHLIILE